MKKYQYTLFICTMLMITFAGCHKDEPQDPATDFSNLPPLEKILPGTWVSLSEQDGLYRYEFSADGSYQVFIQSPEDKVAMGSGEYAVDSKVGTLSLNPVSISGELYRFYHLKDWSDTKLLFIVPTLSGETRERQFLRVAESYLENSKSYITLNTPDDNKSSSLSTISIITPDIISYEPTNHKMKFLNNGVGYATVETSDGLEYLEFIGSTLTQLPYNFFDHFGQLIQVAKSFEKWNEEFSPDSDNGISEIRYVGVHQTEYVRDIIVYLKNEVPHLAVYRILKESYPHFELRRHKGPNSVSGYYTDDNGYDILGWSPDNHKLYFCSDRKDLDRELIGVRFSKEFLLY